jgi:hypothetical protein
MRTQQLGCRPFEKYEPSAEMSAVRQQLPAESDNNWYGDTDDRMSGQPHYLPNRAVLGLFATHRHSTTRTTTWELPLPNPTTDL